MAWSEFSDRSVREDYLSQYTKPLYVGRGYKGRYLLKMETHDMLMLVALKIAIIKAEDDRVTAGFWSLIYSKNVVDVPRPPAKWTNRVGFLAYMGEVYNRTGMYSPTTPV